MESKTRLAKKIAESGVASRREAEKLIESGHVAVDGQIVKTPVFFVDNSSEISVNGKSITKKSEEIIIWKFHKPRSVIVTKNDPRNRKTAFDFLQQNKSCVGQRLIFVGRLDYNSEGLLLFTNSGDAARKMELPSTGLKRIYRAKILGTLSKEKIQEFKDGATIKGIKYKSADIKIDRRNQANFWITITLSEGKNREIRKMMEYAGCIVSRLIRTGYGPFSLGTLPPGHILQASQQEVANLLKVLEMST